MGRHTAHSEFETWMNSMEYMYKVLNDNTIPENVGFQKLHENEERMKRQLEIEELQRVKEDVRKLQEEAEKRFEDANKQIEEANKRADESSNE